MKTRIETTEQVKDFLSSLAPDPKKRLRQGIRDAAEGKGDLKILTGNLSDYSRLRVTDYRVIYSETFEGGDRVMKCLFAERRNVVYELFAEVLKNFPA
jgi:mRNA-degrading endonuclease RelE of RelBE toxin-antitoxin system